MTTILSIFSRIFLLEVFSPYSNEDVLDQKDAIFWNGTHKKIFLKCDFPYKVGARDDWTEDQADENEKNALNTSLKAKGEPLSSPSPPSKRQRMSSGDAVSPEQKARMQVSDAWK